jgi:energy-coupling factor transporter ATP-binding protein EcfA2
MPIQDEDPMLIVLGFVAAAGFGSGLPLLGLLGLLACAGHIAAKVDPEGAPARLLDAGQSQVNRLAGAARDHLPDLPAIVDDTPGTPAGDLFDLLLEGHHALIVGHTGGGKSTLLHALAAGHATAGAQVLVVDVDSIAGRYPGYRVVGSGDDYPAAHAGLVIVKREMQRRREARRAGAREFNRMVLLIDETQDVVREIEAAWSIIEDVIRRGRKVNIFTVIAAQDSQVRTLNLAGKSHLLGNLTRVDVQRRGGQRVALVGRHAYPLPALRSPDEIVQPRKAQPVQTSPTPATPDHQSAALLAELLTPGLPQSDGQSGRSHTDQPDQSATSADHTPPRLDQAAIRAAYARLGSKNKVWEWLRAQYGIRAKPEALRLINEALDTGSDDRDDEPPAAFGWLAE